MTLDVLQVIKTDQQEVCDLFGGFVGASVKDISAAVSTMKARLSQHLHVEKNYLYPEIDGFLKRSDVYAGVWQANHRSIERAFQRFAREVSTNALDRKKAGQRIEKLMKLCQDHFEAQNEVILPALRKNVPTACREELAHVFLDAKEEAAAASKKPALPKKKAGLKRA